MDKDTERLLYTTKDGRWYWETDYAGDKLELDKEDIDFERIPKIKNLLKPASNWKEIYIPLEAAQILASWGNNEGLNYLKYVIELRPDKWGNGELHRLRNYDTTYEWIGKSIFWYCIRHNYNFKDTKTKELIIEIFSRILEFASEQRFEVPFLYAFKELLADDMRKPLRKYLRAVLANDKFHYYKSKDAVKFFIKYDPQFLEKTLNDLGKNISEYKVNAI